MKGLFLLLCMGLATQVYAQIERYNCDFSWLRDNSVKLIENQRFAFSNEPYNFTIDPGSFYLETLFIEIENDKITKIQLSTNEEVELSEGGGGILLTMIGILPFFIDRMALEKSPLPFGI